MGKRTQMVEMMRISLMLLISRLLEAHSLFGLRNLMLSDLLTDNSINSSEDSRMTRASISMKRRSMKCARITSNLLRSFSTT
jgi:hypothetical protein